MLLPGDTYALFSQDIQMLCRLVDRVTVKGSNVPMDLYTYDVPPSLGEGRAGQLRNARVPCAIPGADARCGGARWGCADAVR